MIVTIDYTNWRGVRALRKIRPTGVIRFGTSSFHNELQWFVEAIDMEKQEIRDFAMNDIHSWTSEKEPKKHVMIPHGEDE